MWWAAARVYQRLTNRVMSGAITSHVWYQAITSSKYVGGTCGFLIIGYLSYGKVIEESIGWLNTA